MYSEGKRGLKIGKKCGLTKITIALVQNSSKRSITVRKCWKCIFFVYECPLLPISLIRRKYDDFCTFLAVICGPINSNIIQAFPTKTIWPFLLDIFRDFSNFDLLLSLIFWLLFVLCRLLWLDLSIFGGVLGKQKGAFFTHFDSLNYHSWSDPIFLDFPSSHSNWF